MGNAVFITGGAVRIGRELALSFARQGWDVGIHYHRSQGEAESLSHEISSMGRKAATLQADLRDADRLPAILRKAGETIGPMRCLVNNAALFEKDNLTTLSEARWQAHMQVNMLAPLILARAFAEQCPADGEGNIINILDSCYGWSLSPNFLSYTLSKTGLHTATRLLAESLAPHIRVNGIAPGPTLPGKQDKPDTFNKLAHAIPLKHTSSVDDICNALRMILSTTSMTGQVIALSGGLRWGNAPGEEI